MTEQEPSKKIPLGAEIRMLEIYVNYPKHNPEEIVKLREQLRNHYNYRIKPDYAPEEVKRLEWLELEVNNKKELIDFLDYCNTNIPEEQIKRILANYKP